MLYLASNIPVSFRLGIGKYMSEAVYQQPLIIFASIKSTIHRSDDYVGW